jgi:mono/diheme cytochrome c family protein
MEVGMRISFIWRSLPRLSVFAACAFIVCSSGRPQANQGAAATAAPQNVVERGKYLVTIGGCHDCHTPKKMGPNGPEPDMSRALAGHPQDVKITAPPNLAPGTPWMIATTPTLTAWSGPWGISFAANLTPEQKTGLGMWTEEMFIKAIRTGKHMGMSRPILPPMPWQDIAAMTDDDLKAVFAYLRSIPPVVNVVPLPIPPAPGK